VISPLRMRGMDGVLFRLKRQVAARVAAGGGSGDGARGAAGGVAGRE
jgi:hypothetical protein